MSETIHGLSTEAYHHSPEYADYISSSQLKLYAVSPKAYKYAMEHPTEQTDALRFGSLFHDLMAYLAESKGDWQRGYAEWLGRLARFDAPVNQKTGQPYGSTTKTYAEAYQQFLADNESKTIVNATDSDLASDMAYALLNNCGSTSEQVRKLLKWGKSEVSHFVEVDGCKCKFRPDLETKKKIIDYKTVATDDLSERSVNNIIARYGYDISAAFYLYLEHEQSGIWGTFYWLFVSKQPPYDAVLVDASEWTYKHDDGIVLPQVGAIKMKRLLDLHAKCLKDNEWPGAEINIPKDDFGQRIMRPKPPTWEVNNAANIIEQSFEET